MSTGLSQRLHSAAELVRQGAVFADIGTDHAYLPIFLLKRGSISAAYAADINEGPLASAVRNAEESGVSDKMHFILTDGITALAGLGITDYAVCGMGGELIADIIDRAPHLCDGVIRLILQPMSKQAELRRYLYKNGYAVEREIYSHDAGKYYVTLAVKYTGEIRDIDLSEAELGLKTPDFANISCQIGYFKVKIKSLKKKINGKICGELDAKDEEKLLAEMLSFVALLERESSNL